MFNQENAILKIHEVIDVTKRSKTSIYRDIKSEKFPHPVKLGDNSVGWKWSDIKNWLDGLDYA